MALAEDDELVALFEAEATERLTRLADLLLQLDAGGATDDLVAALFREAHTLKGSADMVGLSNVAAAADALETLLDDVRSGARTADAALVDELFAGVDALSELAGVPARAALSRLASPGPAMPAATTNGDAAAGNANGNGSPAPAAEQRAAPRETARVPVERLDDIVRLAGEASAAHLQICELVREHLGFDPYNLPEMRALSRHLTELQDRTLRARMLPLSDIAPALRRTARDLARRTGKEIRFEVRGEATELDRNVHERLGDALVHLVRNAVDHGIESPLARTAHGKPECGTIILHAAQVGSRVVVSVSDDGRGIDIDALRARAGTLGIDTTTMDDADVRELLFRPGFTTAPTGSDFSGRGVGLDAVKAGLAALRGRVEISSEPGEGTTFRIIVPSTLTVLRSLVVRVGGVRCALGLHGVQTVLSDDTNEVPVEGRAAIRVGAQIVQLGSLATMVGVTGRPGGPVVVLRSGDRSRAVRVDEILGQREVLVKAMPGLVPPSELVVGASAEPDGSAMLVLDTDAIVARGSAAVAMGPMDGATGDAPIVGYRGSVLVVDDALTVRELQRTILQRAGYEVRTAGDGAEALERLAEAPADLVLTDVEMDGLDGLGLTRAIREDARWRNLPVVLLTSRGAEEDRRRGLEAGADAYIVKSAFDEAGLLGIVEDLLGRSA